MPIYLAHQANQCRRRFHSEKIESKAVTNSIPEDLLKRIEAFESNNNPEKLTEVVEKMRQIKKSYEEHIKTLQESYESKIQFYINEVQIKDKIISEQDKKMLELLSLRKDMTKLDNKMSDLEKQTSPRPVQPKKTKFINTISTKKDKGTKVKTGWRL